MSTASQSSQTPRRKQRRSKGIVRAGQFTPYYKGTSAEIERRIEEVAQLLVACKSRFQIHKAVCGKFKLKWKVIDEIYIPRARKLLAQRANIGKDSAKAAGVNILLDVLRTGSTRERLMAERSLAAIFGYDAPRRQEFTGANGGPLEVDLRPLRGVSEERLREMAEWSAQHEPKLLDGGNGTNGGGQ